MRRKEKAAGGVELTVARDKRQRCALVECFIAQGKRPRVPRANLTSFSRPPMRAKRRPRLSVYSPVSEVRVCHSRGSPAMG